MFSSVIRLGLLCLFSPSLSSLRLCVLIRVVTEERDPARLCRGVALSTYVRCVHEDHLAYKVFLYLFFLQTSIFFPFFLTFQKLFCNSVNIASNNHRDYSYVLGLQLSGFFHKRPFRLCSFFGLVANTCSPVLVFGFTYWVLVSDVFNKVHI